MQNDLILDYRSNVALYPEFQKYALDNWAKNSYSLFGCRLWR